MVARLSETDGVEDAVAGLTMVATHQTGTVPTVEAEVQTGGETNQHFNLIPTLAARDNVAAALAPQGVSKEERRRRSTGLLEQMGLGDRVEHLPSRLSGGEQERVAIARAVINPPKVLLADEPTGNLDSATTDEVVSLLSGLIEDDVTVVLVTHAAEVAERAARRVTLSDGKVVGDTA